MKCYKKAGVSCISMHVFYKEFIHEMLQESLLHFQGNLHLNVMHKCRISCIINQCNMYILYIVCVHILFPQSHNLDPASSLGPA